MSNFIITDLLYNHAVLSDKLTVIDCGAAGGSFHEWGSLGDKLVVYAFDPDDKECARLNSEARSKGLAHFYYPNIISNTSENRLFYMTNNSYSNSLLEPDINL